MPNALRFIQRTAIFLGLALAATLPAHAQAVNMEGKTAEQVYKNIKVLTGTPADQLNQGMHLIESATGMDCEVCHVEDDRAADTLKPKETARQMMQMVIDLNRTQFKGEQVITCYTCHQGRRLPVGSPILPMANPPTPAELEAPVVLPSVDQILTKYIGALGGEQAIRKLTSRVITGTLNIPSGPGGGVPMPAMIERSQKAPNMFVNVYRTPTYTIFDGFDGAKAWALNIQGRVAEPAAVDQGRARRDADFYLPLNLKQQYTSLKVEGITRVNGREAYQVVGTPRGDVPERLYFDAVTGLLLRKATFLPTPAGPSPYEVNFEDYRDTGSGTKFPYLITMTPPGPRVVVYGSSTLRVTKVQDNPPLDNAKFAKPQPRPAPAQ